MRVESLFGKITQLCSLPPGDWRNFINGWLRRQQNGFVPGVLAGCRRLVWVPLREFYETYGYFCEHPVGRRELRYFLTQLRPHEIFYDIGAFRGAYSASVKLNLRDAVSLHVFEPLPKNARAVRTIFELNHFMDFKINEIAVNDGAPLSGNVNEQDEMLRLGDAHADQPAKFATVTLDHYVALGNPPPTLIKIDVEGFEMQVLQGGRLCLAQHRPRLWIEIHPDYLVRQGIAAEDIFNWLRQIGYKISFFDDFLPQNPKAAYHIWCE